MARVRLGIVTGHGSVQAAAPTFVEIPGSYQGDPTVCDLHGVFAGVLLGSPLLGAVTVLVDVPDEDCTAGALDPVKIKARYPNHFLVKSGVIK